MKTITNRCNLIIAILLFTGYASIGQKATPRRYANRHRFAPPTEPVNKSNGRDAAACPRG